MNLFEAGILDKMTNSEYEKMFGAQTQKEINVDIEKTETLSQVQSKDGSDILQIQTKTQELSRLEPISLRMLKGAFFVLLSGLILAALVLFFENIEHQYRCIFKLNRRWKRYVRKLIREWHRLKIHEILHRYI